VTKSVLNVVVLILCFVGGFTVQSSVAKQAPSELTFKTAAREVSVPVVVLDSKGRAVGNLTRSSFEIFDNGKRQALSGFETQVAPGVTQGHSVTRTDQTGGTGQQSPALSEVMNQPARYIAILFDDIHSESGDLVRVRKSVSHVLTSSLTNADAAAILSTSGRVNTGFTHDWAANYKRQSAILEGYLVPHVQEVIVPILTTTRPT
jgi:VWFA-related protein